MWRLLVVSLIVALLLLPVRPVFAGESEDTAEVVITAQGFIVGSPTGLTFTYISDYEIGITWTMGVDATRTLIRRTVDRPVDDIEDGVVVYNGTEESCSDWIDISTAPRMFYRAWSMSTEGIWEEVGTSGEARFMSQSWMLIAFMGLGLGLMVVNFRRRHILLAMASSMMWLVLSMWLFFSANAPIGFDETWKEMLAWVFFILVFVPLLLQMDTEITHEREGKKYTRYGAPPKEEGPSAYEEYRDKLFQRTRRR